MKQGNWVPISKALIKSLPLNREYTELEAMFSLAVDYDNSNPASVSGYSSLWGWSRKRVSNFLDKYGVAITYEDKFNRHKKGEIGKKLGVPYGEQEGNRWGAGKAQVEFIDSKALCAAGDRRGTGGEQEGNRKGSSTTDPNPNPNPKKTNTGAKTDASSFRPEWFPETLWAEFIGNRKFKKLQNTELALKTICNALKAGVDAGYPLEDCVGQYVSSKWNRFDYSWMKSRNNGNSRQEAINGIQSIRNNIEQQTGFNPYAILNGESSCGDADQACSPLPAIGTHTGDS